AGAGVPVLQVVKLADADLQKLPAVPYFFELVVGRGVTDRGLEALRRFSTLVALQCRGSKVTAARLPELSELPIAGLSFLHTPLSDADLAGLKKFRFLRGLDLGSTAITHRGLAHLAGLNLRTLRIPAATRTEQALPSYLAAIEPPTALDLSGWKIRD